MWRLGAQVCVEGEKGIYLMMINSVVICKYAMSTNALILKRHRSSSLHLESWLYTNEVKASIFLHLLCLSKA